MFILVPSTQRMTISKPIIWGFVSEYRQSQGLVRGIGLESSDRHAPRRQTLISPWRYETGKATLTHGTRSHTHTGRMYWAWAFCVQMRHIQRLLIYKEALRPPLCPASMKSEFEGGEKKEIGSEADLEGKKRKKKHLFYAQCDKIALATAETNARCPVRSIADAH